MWCLKIGREVINNEKTKKTLEEPLYIAAKSILPVMMDEYTKEKERSGIIDNKAITLLTIILALLTVYMPLIPFKEIREKSIECSLELCCLIIAGLLFLGALVISIIIFSKLLGVIKLQKYQHVEIKEVTREESLKVPEDEAEKALCVHYCNLIECNAEINNMKAKKINNCFVMTIILFLLLMCSTLILLMI